MTLLTNELLADLLSAHQPPCLSLYSRLTGAALKTSRTRSDFGTL